MIIFSFILVVFLFLFALITQQRAVTLNSQTFSQLQLVAQSVALQISRAAQAGAGYSALVPITTNIGNIAYNLSVTKNGVVIVSTQIGTQVIRTTAYSNIQSLISDPAFYGATNGIYVLPIGNGSIYLQNSFGNVCVDYQCPLNSNQSNSVSLSSQVVHVGNFNGQSTKITIASQNSISFERTNSFSISFWAKANAIPSTSGFLEKFDFGGTTGYYIRQDPGQLYFVIASASGGNGVTAQLSRETRDGKWHNIVTTYDGSSSSNGLKIYIDGSITAPTLSGTLTTSVQTSQPLIIGPYASSGDLNGSMANVQIYNVLLSASQVQNIYGAGISGSPIQSNAVAGWWPLNGNANDYSGQGANGAVTGPLLFTSVAQISALVKNPAGQAINSILVGFATTIGNFTNGMGLQQAQSNYTNANGIATVFLNQQGNNGRATVTATSLGGNFLPAANIVAWYPLNSGQGTVAYDLSGNKNTGTFSGFGTLNGLPTWNLPNYVASIANLGGSYGYITVADGLADTFTTQMSYSVWVKRSSGASSYGARAIVVSKYGTYIDLCSNNQALFSLNLNSGQQLVSGGSCIYNNWVNYIVTYDGSTARLYQNGVQVGSVSASSTILNAPTPLTIGMYDGSGYYFNGSTANVQIYKQGLTASQVSQLYNEGLTGAPISNSQLSGWWPLNGDAYDNSGNGNNGIIYGSVSFTPTSQVLSQGQAASGNLSRVMAANFLAQGSIPILNSSVLNPTNSLSLSAWIYPSISQTKVIAAKNNVLSGAGIDYELLQYNQNIHFDLAKGGATTILASNDLLVLNSWNYVVGTYDGNALKIYVNGVQDSNTVSLSAPIDISANTFTIGAYWNGGYAYNGLISNVQLYNSTLNAQQIMQLYSQGIEGSPAVSASLIAPSLVGWWPLNGNKNDYGLNGLNGTTSANVAFRNVINYIPSLLTSSAGVNFNGQSAYINVPSSSSYDLNGKYQITFSAWINMKNFTSSGQQMIFEDNSEYYLSVGPSTAPKVGVYLAGLSPLGYYLSGTNLNTNQWYQVGFTYNGSKAIVYLNGVATNTISVTGSVSATQQGLEIGAEQQTNSKYFNGSISNVQIYNVALTKSQMQQLYNIGSPPSAYTTIPLSWFP